jgi:hypothetical protein
MKTPPESHNDSKTRCESTKMSRNLSAKAGKLRHCFQFFNMFPAKTKPTTTLG